MCPYGKYTNTNYVNIKHYKKYKNPICKNDKNESLPQPIKSLSSSSYQLIEDYVSYCICRQIDFQVLKLYSDVIVCTKSSRIALDYVRFKLIKRTKSVTVSTSHLEVLNFRCQLTLQPCRLSRSFWSDSQSCRLSMTLKHFY